MGNWKNWIRGLLLTLPLAAQAQVDLTALGRAMVGPRSKILVLGTVHLREMPKDFNAVSLDRVLDRLATFSPDIITIEEESGEECDLAARHPAKYGTDYCGPTDAAREATGLDVPAAIVEVDMTLKAWPAQPTAAQRRHLAGLFFAANDRVSAYVQWLQLPDAERRSGDSLSAALVEMLVQDGKRNDEKFQLAARLAARLGLPRVHAVDNHTGDKIDVPDIKAFGQSIEAAWGTGSEEFKERIKREHALSQAHDLLPLYRYINEPEHLRVLAETNVRLALNATSPQGYPQMWVAGWEIRNLRMVANIRETFRERPGARVLTIVGASHKPWFDAWLGQLQGVNIVDVERVLE
ncbi:DUF5694 domain-containing protein [Actimicrobium sp. CCI2.3]|uniref:DUF5694 domain-containing protein n=1 Tax=Actimicrobium sp. CCI2.3 TaxID=3048616 RepID=UPI002AB3FF2A|nr:DUF5694 domain-containing protein [Actimicrobium sp. CCI2.3]MDY7573052.1 DUF5694 domain-containing protein [Actimicrobium sp. CCI2.3]MEB0020850.1 DUF5694 domain-containing protein [Actimicrobium sp. CCI2.3]